jgi:UDP-N-acetylglucosamine/UDP-N-acetylgalactosamine diphosphorylase
MGASQQDAALRRMVEGGVTIVDPRQTYVAPDVDPARICQGAILHPGTRICGRLAFVGPGAQVGAQGPATLDDAVLAPGAIVDAGYLQRAVLLQGARVGWGGHLRPGTLMEEGASTAHCVGLKHTILLAHVTIGSVVNFCDVLMAGGTSAADHSEVGSGFIHFNFTPWGARGDKATPSLVGDVVRGVFLRQRRIFLGGSSGMIGPRRIGYGAVTAAGQVVRRDVADDRIVLQAGQTIDRPHAEGFLDPVRPRADANVAYLAQLCALRAWYRAVRGGRLLSTAPVWQSAPVAAALATIDECIDERFTRLEAFLRERGAPSPSLHLEPDVPCPLPVARDPELSHLDWVAQLSDEEVEAGALWLRAIADAVTVSAEAGTQ